MAKKKVYCGQCKHVQPNKGSSTPEEFTCKTKPRIIHTPLERQSRQIKCFNRNKNNECKLYEASVYLTI